MGGQAERYLEIYWCGVSAGWSIYGPSCDLVEEVKYSAQDRGLSFFNIHLCYIYQVHDNLHSRFSYFLWITVGYI